MLDVLNLVTFLGAVQGFFFGLLLLGLPKGNRTANRLLAAFLLLFSVSMIGIIAYSSRWILRFPHLGLIHAPFASVNSIPLYLYFLALTRKGFRLEARHWALFTPFLIATLGLMPFYVLTAREKYDILWASYANIPVAWKVSFIFSALMNFIGLAATYVVILRHERLIREIYSSPLNKTLLWARNFLYAGTATFFLCVIVSIFSFNWADPASNLVYSIIIYIFGYRAMRQPDIFTDIAEATFPQTDGVPLVRQGGKYEKSGLSPEKARVLLEKLDRLMTEEHLFLDPDLNLQQLGARLELPPHQVSQLLNQFRGESFSDFVNRFRVEYFKKAIANPANAHLSLLAIAFDSGFNSKAAFNAVFKKMTGMTPSAFKEQLI